MLSRREMLRHAALGTAGLALAPFTQHMQALAAGDPAQLPKRFVFFLTGHGIGSHYLMPDRIFDEKYAGRKDQAKRRPNQHWDVYSDKVENRELAGMPLPEWLSALEPVKDRVTCVLGLSGRMCSGFHSAGYGVLGAQRAQSKQQPLAETIDGALSKLCGGIFPHLAMGGGGFSALGKNCPLTSYGDPLEIYENLFGVISPDASAQVRKGVDGDLLDFMADDVRRFRRRLPGSEQQKLEPYLNAFQAMGTRHRQLLARTEVLKKLAPKIPPPVDEKSPWEDVADLRCELATNALIGGLLNVVTINMDAGGSGSGYGTRSGFDTLRAWHGTGHSNDFQTRIGPFRYNVGQIAKMAKALDAVPEGDGTMLDNTLILAISMSGAVHHTKCDEFPMLLVGGGFGRLRTGRYVQYPHWGQTGNRTIGNMYTTLLHAAGHPRDGFNFCDITMDEKIQREPLPELLI